MVRVLKINILLIGLSTVVFSLNSCKNTSTETEQYLQDIDRIIDRISEFYSVKVPNKDILVLSIRDSIDLFDMSLDRIPDKTKISVCFSDDTEFYLNHNLYNDYSLFMDELKQLILKDDDDFENNTISLFISHKSIENTIPSLLKDIYKIEEIPKHSEGIYIFIFSNKTTKCFPPLPPPLQ